MLRGSDYFEMALKAIKMNVEMTQKNETALSRKPNFFQNNFFKDRFVSSQLCDGIQNFNSCEFALAVVVCGNTFSQVLRRDGSFAETNVEGIDLRIIGYSHKRTSSIPFTVIRQSQTALLPS